ncbi:MAG: hypothetical protein LBQ16_05385 [Gracilibacteraceae bacterium]|jgi:diphthamide synthase subunit DPH2|nr:hypothetical protein [Gracilibacteraceae bacterium]
MRIFLIAIITLFCCISCTDITIDSGAERGKVIIEDAEKTVDMLNDRLEDLTD